MLKSDKLDYIEVSEEEKYPIAFNLNVNAELQRRYGSMSDWSERIFPTSDADEEKEADLSVLIETCAIMINEGIDIEEASGKMITEKEAGRILSKIGTAKLVDKIIGEKDESDDVEEDTPSGEPED